ncbi:MAG: hypothetical protein KUG69_13835 [Marinosulfonomonas sp.]|nr:hypothetical protein [Marinosulfonomonas sp.]
MTQSRLTEFSALPTSLVIRRATDAYLALSFLYISLRALWDYRSGGNSWKQGDWLINNAGGEIRRGHFGSAIINISDFFGSSPLFIVVFIQIFVLLILFISFRLLVTSVSNPSISVLLLISPAIFTVFWVADPQGSLRKELLSFAGLSLCALAAMRDRKSVFWLGVSFLCVSFIAHEGMIFFVPTFFGILLISNFHQIAPKHTFAASLVVLSFSIGSFLFAINNSRISDITPICAELLDRGLNNTICDGAIKWLAFDSVEGILRIINYIKTENISGVLFAYVVALAPFFYLVRISKEPVRSAIVLVLSALPFVLLFFIAYDWGRWISFYIFSLTILTACALGNRKIQISQNPPIAHIIILVTISFIIVPKHTIGVQWGGVFRRVVEDFLLIFS